jgi:hypothetical protein
MSRDAHQRAGQLIDRRHIESLSPAERQWLDAHLASCGACAQRARLTTVAIASLRAVVVPVNLAVVSMAKARARMRAAELRRRDERLRPLWIVCVFSWVMMLLTTPYFWSAFEWVGQAMRLPAPVWQAGFLLWWSVPATVAAIALLWLERSGGLFNGRREGAGWLEG